MTEQITIETDKIAVLIMDYQNRQLSNFSEEFQTEILRKANTVLADARRRELPIIHVEVIRGDRTPENAIHRDITPQAGEVLLTKSRTGPFSTTNLNDLLREEEIETLVLMGISTSGCVVTTVRWAADIDYKLIVLSDCCADRDDEVHRVLMEKLFPRQATVMTSDKFLQLLGDA